MLRRCENVGMSGAPFSPALSPLVPIPARASRGEADGCAARAGGSGPNFPTLDTVTTRHPLRRGSVVECASPRCSLSVSMQWKTLISPRDTMNSERRSRKRTTWERHSGAGGFTGSVRGRLVPVPEGLQKNWPGASPRPRAPPPETGPSISVPQRGIVEKGPGCWPITGCPIGSRRRGGRRGSEVAATKNFSDAPLGHGPFGVATGGCARWRGLAPG